MHHLLKELCSEHIVKVKLVVTKIIKRDGKYILQQVVGESYE